MIADVKNDQRFKVNLIIDMLKKQELKKLFIFTCPIIKILEEKNKLFQANFTNPLSAVEERNYLCRSFELRIFDHAGHTKSINDVDFGFEFAFSSPNSDTKMRAFGYLKKVYSELRKRMTNSMEKVKRMEFIKPHLVLNPKAHFLYLGLGSG